MKKEELELIIQAIEKLGAAGQDAFTWWLVFNFLSNLLAPVTWMLFFLMFYKVITYCVDACNKADLEQAKLRN